MDQGSDRPWLPRLLFRLTVALAGLLTLALVFTPWFDTGPGLAATFARDAVVRRTTVGAVVGLVVTAFVFFRRPGGKRDTPRTPPRPRNIAGA